MTSPFPSVGPSLAPTPTPPPTQPPRVPPLHLVVRFLALPDIPLEIADPDRFTVVRLKTLIRRELAARAALEEDDPTSGMTKAQQKQKQTAAELLSPTNLSNAPTLADAPRRRLRILYAGKNLADDVVLGHVLRPVAAPPPPQSSRIARSSSMSTPTPTPPTHTPTPTPAGGPTSYPDGLTPASAAAADTSSRSRSSSTSVGGSGSSGSQSQGARVIVIVSCSISDVLPDKELAAEARAAALSEAAAERAAQKASVVDGWEDSSSFSAGGSSSRSRRDIFQRRGGGSNSTVGGNSGGAGPSGTTTRSSRSTGTAAAPAPASTSAASATTTPAPRGFQRLLQGGFSPAEVNQLRLQFNSIQAARFTPDTMPSPDTLRNMEDRWLDNNHEPAGAGALGTNDDGTGAIPDEEGRLPALLDLMVKAMLVGFMLPLASGCWLLREEGLWTARWRMFVSLGMMVSILIGMIKAFAGEW